MPTYKVESYEMVNIYYNTVIISDKTLTKKEITEIVNYIEHVEQEVVGREVYAGEVLNIRETNE